MEQPAFMKSPLAVSLGLTLGVALAVVSPNISATSGSYQYSPQLVRDGSGGHVVVWEDHRSDNYDVYAQRVNGAGALQWSSDAVGISTVAATQFNPVIVADDSGGAIILWDDFRDGNRYQLFTQRVNHGGVVQWARDGLRVATGVRHQLGAVAVQDGSGGVIVVWTDSLDEHVDLRAQRVNAKGETLWGSSGLIISNAPNDQYNPQIVSDGSDGAIVVWEDFRNGNADLYAQRVGRDGRVLWAANGIPVSRDSSAQNDPRMVIDGSGGAIIAWMDQRHDGQDIYAQRINGAGKALWNSDGVAVSVASHGQVEPRLTVVGDGGAIVGWTDTRNQEQDIYAQRVSSEGSLLWGAQGIPVCTAKDEQSGLQMTPDGTGGAILAWEDRRNGANLDIFAQRISGSGVLQWASDGVPVAAADNNQSHVQLVDPGDGSFVLVWSDFRNAGPNNEVFAQRLNSAGAPDWGVNGTALVRRQAIHK
jgi:hypothetical protein